MDSKDSLAEACHMDTLLAHCELSMIRDRDEYLWIHPAIASHVSRNCLLRMLRASHLLERRADGFHLDIATLMEWKPEMTLRQ